MDNLYIQIDRSNGQGHCWQDASADDLPADIRQEIDAEVIDGKRLACADYLASNGQHYRWDVSLIFARKV